MIPKTVRAAIAGDPFMAVCIYQYPDAPNHDCAGRITWEHAWIYQGKQIQEPWAIVPCCTAHNSGAAMVKDYNRYRALQRADLDDLAERFPERDWRAEMHWLDIQFTSMPAVAINDFTPGIATSQDDPFFNQTTMKKPAAKKSKFIKCGKCGTESTMARCYHCGNKLQDIKPPKK